MKNKMCISLPSATVAENTFCSGKQQLICKLQLQYMQSSCATSHKFHFTVVRFKTKLELSKNFIFPKKQISWLFNNNFNTVQFEVFTVVDKNYSLDAKVIGNDTDILEELASSTFRVVYKVHVVWEN